MRSTTRLNAGIRRHIFQEVLKHRFDAEINLLKQSYAEVARLVYDRTFTVEQIMLLASLPDGWCEAKNGIDLYISGHHHWITFSGAIFWDRHTGVRDYDTAYFDYEKEQRPMPHYYSGLKVKANDPLATQFGRLEHTRVKLQDDFGTVKKQVETMLKSCTTLGTLVEAWPEVEPFLPAKSTTTTAPVAKLPAVSIPSLNILLRLPVENKADFVQQQDKAKVALTCI